METTKVYDCTGAHIEIPTRDFKMFEAHLRELCKAYGLTPVSWDGEVEIGFIDGYYNGGKLVSPGSR